MLQPDTRIWLNGEITTFGNGQISLLTHTLHYGTGVFEGIRAYATDKGTSIFRLKEHIRRLQYSAGRVDIEIPYSTDTLADACRAVVRENGLQSGYIRPVVFLGDESMGLVPTKNSVNVAILAWPWGRYLEDDARVKISEFRRISELSLPTDAKVCGNYVNSTRASTAARRAGYTEALLLDHAGNIAEGPGENVFFIRGKELHTPALGKILAGITRDSVLHFAEDIGYTVHEREIDPGELAGFDAAFFTGTAAEISPIISIDDISYGRKQVVPFVEKYEGIVHGKDSRYADWLCFVD